MFWGILDWTTVLLFVVAAILAFLVKAYAEVPWNLPPTPAFAFPIVGHLPYLSKDLRGTLAKWKKQTGEIYTLYMGNKRIIVLNSLDIFKETLVKQADKFSDRVLSSISISSGISEGRGIVRSSGSVWKEQRSVSQTILRQLGMGKNFLAEKIQEEMKEYLEELSKFKGEKCNVHTLTQSSVSNNICSIVFGKRFQLDDPEFIRMLHLLDEQFKLLSINSLRMCYPIVALLPGDPFRLLQAVKNSGVFERDFANARLLEHREHLQQVDTPTNFIDAYLLEMKGRNEKGRDTHLNDHQLNSVVVEFFLAGTETTSSTILWFMLYMVHHPDIQQKVYDEIVKVVGTNRFPKISEKEEMTYLQACILETQRISSVVPTNVMHFCNSEAKVSGYTIPANTRVMPNLDSILRDEKTWGDPEAFRPERFLDEDGGIVIPESFIPFGMGRRICVGEPLAKMELFLYLSSIIQKFQLMPPEPGELPPLDAVDAFTSPPEPYYLRFIQRSS